MYCSHARESACVEGWCAKLAKRKQVDVICIVGSVNYKFILVQNFRRKKEEKKEKKKREKKEISCCLSCQCTEKGDCYIPVGDRSVFLAIVCWGSDVVLVFKHGHVPLRIVYGAG